MNRIAMDAAARGGPGRLALVLLGVASLAALGLAGRGPGQQNGGGGGGTSGGIMDDEAIGSLPSQVGGSPIFLAPGAPHPALHPSFYVEGPTDLLLGAILDAHGLGHVSLHPAAEPGRSLAVLYGPVHLDLDAALFTHPEVEAGLIAGPAVGRVSGAIFLHGDLLRHALIDPSLGHWSLPMREMLAQGLLKGEGVALLAGGPRAGRQLFGLHAFGGVVTLDQMN